MAELNHNVNPQELESTFDPVPAGEYYAVIIDSDIVPTKTGTGQMLKLKYEIIDGPLKGRNLFENLNIVNVNKQAEEIARKSLNSIGVAVGIDKIQDSAQLHNIPLKIDVSVKESADYGKQNSIKKHLPANGSAPAAPQAPAGNGQIPTPPPANGTKKPWER